MDCPSLTALAGYARPPLWYVCLQEILEERAHGEPAGERDEPVPAAAQGQPRGLVPVGGGGAREGAGGGQADPALRRLLGLPLVPRHGARVLRGRRDGAHDERALRQYKGGPRGAAGHRLDLHVRRAGPHPQRRLAYDGLYAPRRTGDRGSLAAVETTLRRMADGGICDHLGGGFARYSVDEFWLVPHFEKMLYDNALLARIYLEAHQATGDPFYRRIAEETLDYVLRDMTSPEGGFYSAEDADSEGVEGKFYVWTPTEIEGVLDPEDARLALRFWDVTEGGNFESKNILNVPRPLEVVADEFGLAPEELWDRIVAIREKLLAFREERVRPGRDEKVLAAWNGLMLRAFALAARVTGREDYREAARRNATFLLENMKTDGRLRRSHKDGRARFNGYLEDYAMVADGLVGLYEATFETRWLAEADNLCDAMNELFWDEGRRAFYDTPADHEELVTRPRDVYDNATPSGNSVAVEVMLRLALLLDRNDYRERAEEVLEEMAGGMEKIPSAFGRLLAALDFATSGTREVAIIGDPEAPDTKALIETVYARYLPNKVVAGRREDDAESAGLIPLLAERPKREDKATAYVCEGYACKAPTADPEELARQLAG